MKTPNGNWARSRVVGVFKVRLRRPYRGNARAGKLGPDATEGRWLGVFGKSFGGNKTGQND